MVVVVAALTTALLLGIMQLSSWKSWKPIRDARAGESRQTLLDQLAAAGVSADVAQAVELELYAFTQVPARINDRLGRTLPLIDDDLTELLVQLWKNVPVRVKEIADSPARPLGTVETVGELALYFEALRGKYGWTRNPPRNLEGVSGRQPEVT